MYFSILQFFPSIVACKAWSTILGDTYRLSNKSVCYKKYTTIISFPPRKVLVETIKTINLKNLTNYLNVKSECTKTEISTLFFFVDVAVAFTIQSFHTI